MRLSSCLQRWRPNFHQQHVASVTSPNPVAEGNGVDVGFGEGVPGFGGCGGRGGLSGGITGFSFAHGRNMACTDK